MVNVVKTITITEYNVKNFKTVISLTHRVLGRFIFLLDTNGQSELLDNFVNYLLDVSKTP